MGPQQQSSNGRRAVASAGSPPMMLVKSIVDRVLLSAVAPCTHEGEDRAPLNGHTPPTRRHCQDSHLCRHGGSEGRDEGEEDGGTHGRGGGQASGAGGDSIQMVCDAARQERRFEIL